MNLYFTYSDKLYVICTYAFVLHMCIIMCHYVA